MSPSYFASCEPVIPGQAAIYDRECPSGLSDSTSSFPSYTSHSSLRAATSVPLILPRRRGIRTNRVARAQNARAWPILRPPRLSESQEPSYSLSLNSKVFQDLGIPNVLTYY